MAHNAMPTKKISTKRNVFLQLVKLRPHPHLPSHPQKNPQNHPHFTRLKIRRSANLHFTIGPQGRLQIRVDMPQEIQWQTEVLTIRVDKSLNK